MGAISVPEHNRRAYTARVLACMILVLLAQRQCQFQHVTESALNLAQPFSRPTVMAGISAVVGLLPSSSCIQRIEAHFHFRILQDNG